MSTEAGANRIAYGVTSSQLDLLQQLTGGIRAQGDVLTVGRLHDLAPGSLEAIGDLVFQSACEAREIVDQIWSQQRLADIGKAPKSVITQEGPSTFDSDMDGALLQAFSVMQLMHIAANEDNGLDDASSACQLVSELVWKVHEYVVANFDALPKFASSNDAMSTADDAQRTDLHDPDEGSF